MEWNEEKGTIMSEYRICPKFGYQRTPSDDELILDNECPNCGIIYEKFTTAPSRVSPDSPDVFEEQGVIKKGKGISGPAGLRYSL